MADTESGGVEKQRLSAEGREVVADAIGCRGFSKTANADSQPTERPATTWSQCGGWLPEPNVGRVAHGVPARVDRLKGLGNAVVPQIPEIIGRAIMASVND